MQNGMPMGMPPGGQGGPPMCPMCGQPAPMPNSMAGPNIPPPMPGPPGGGQPGQVDPMLLQMLMGGGGAPPGGM